MIQKISVEEGIEDGWNINIWNTFVTHDQWNNTLEYIIHFQRLNHIICLSYLLLLKQIEVIKMQKKSITWVVTFVSN
jgi:hypothetical protein